MYLTPPRRDPLRKWSLVCVLARGSWFHLSKNDTNARTLHHVIREWQPFYELFTNVHTSTALHTTIANTLPLQQKMYFAILVPRTFDLRRLTVVTPDATLYVTLSVSLTMDYLYYLLIHHFLLAIGPFSLHNSQTLLTRQHWCKHLQDTRIQLIQCDDGPQFTCPSS